jgi:hypothetical protein
MRVVDFGMQQMPLLKGLFAARNSRLDGCAEMGWVADEPLHGSQLLAGHTCAGECEHCGCWLHLAGRAGQRTRLGGRRYWWHL